MDGTSGFNKLVLDLLAEKDRLIGEKDELVESKNKLWREYHDIAREKDREIEQLRQEVRDLTAENGKVKGKAMELQAALQELLDDESDSAEENEGDERKDSRGRMSVQEEHRMFTAPSQALRDDTGRGRRFADSKLSPAASADDSEHVKITAPNNAGPTHRSLNIGPRLGSRAAIPQHDKVPTAESSDLTRLRSQARRPSAFQAPLYSQASTPDGIVLNLDNSSRLSSTSHRATPAQSLNAKSTEHEAMFTFAPLKQAIERGGYEIGKMDGLARPVIDSIRSTMSEITKRHKEGQSAAHPSPQLQRTCCAWLWMVEKGYQIRWTLASPQNYACFSCFNARRTCLRWLGKMKWMVLPIPPQTRGHQVTWKDAGYYIYQGRMPTSAFAHLWEESRKTKKRKREDVED